MGKPAATVAVELIPMYFVGGREHYEKPGWFFGPAGYSYRYQDAQPDEVEIAEAHGWRTTLAEAIQVYDDSLSKPDPEPTDKAAPPTKSKKG